MKNRATRTGLGASLPAGRQVRWFGSPTAPCGARGFAPSRLREFASAPPSTARGGSTTFCGGRSPVCYWVLSVVKIAYDCLSQVCPISRRRVKVDSLSILLNLNLQRRDVRADGFDLPVERLRRVLVVNRFHVERPILNR